MRSNRSHVSRGDSAPRSDRPSADRRSGHARRSAVQSREVGDRSAVEAGRVAQCVESSNGFVESTVTPDIESGSLSGVVTLMPDDEPAFSGPSRSLLVGIPCGERAFAQMSSTGLSSAIQRAPCIAAAASPATTPRRRVHSHAASVRCASDGETPTGRVHIRIQRPESGAQLMLVRDHALAQRLASDEWVSTCRHSRPTVRRPEGCRSDRQSRDLWMNRDLCADAHCTQRERPGTSSAGLLSQRC